MSIEFTPEPGAEFEARITALLLGELNGAEAASLRQQIDADPELTALYERLKKTVALVHEAAATPVQPASSGSATAPLKLSEERRQKLLAQFKTIKPKEFAKPKSPPARKFQWIELAAVLAMLAVLAALLMPALAKSKMKAQKVGMLYNLRQLEGAKQEWALDNHKSADAAPTWKDIQPYMGRGSGEPPKTIAGEKYNLGKVGESVTAEFDAQDAKRLTGKSVVEPPSFGGRVLKMFSGSEPSQVARLDENGDVTLVDGTVFGKLASNQGQKTKGRSSNGTPWQTESLASSTPPQQPAQNNRQQVVLPASNVVDDDGAVLPRPQNGFAFFNGNVGGTAGAAQANTAPAMPPASVVNNSAQLGDRSGLIATNGEPDWVGRLNQPESSKAASNPFIGRYAGPLLDSEGKPIAQLDLDYIHNLAKQQENEPLGAPAPASVAPAQPAATFGLDSVQLAQVKPNSNFVLPGGSLNHSLADDELTMPQTKTESGRASKPVAPPQPQPASVAALALEEAPKRVPAGDTRRGAELLKSDEPAFRGNYAGFAPPSNAGPDYTLGVVSVTPPPPAVPPSLSNQQTQLALEQGREPQQAAQQVQDALKRAVSIQPAKQEELAKLNSDKAEIKGVKESLVDGSDRPLEKPATPAPIPQPEVSTSMNAFSTFSLNIADVSFKLAQASLEKGVMPEPASIRSEEFINAFDYRDPEAPPGAPIAFAWERARYPFAQNRDLLRFSVKTVATGREPGRPLNIVLLLDKSGSMERADRVQIIHEALRVLAGQLQPQDTLSIVTFARTAHLFVDGVPGNRAADVIEQVSGLTPQGGTNLEDAMKLAYEAALRHYLANGVNRVVLLTDGAANLGSVDPAALKQSVEAHRKQGIALDCFGIGWEDYNDDLLETLSRNGDGRYGFLNSPEEAANGFAHQLAGALNVAASDVKVQVEFNPRRVRVYRQIGYAKLQLTKEQFRDNTVAAAQIGAAEAGNALYTLQVDPNGEGPLCTVRVRYRVPGTQDVHEHEWSVPYTGNAVALEQASPAMRLAATASAFSEWLANSPYATEVTPDALLRELSGVPQTFAPDTRPQKLEWMLHQAKSISGK